MRAFGTDSFRDAREIPVPLHIRGRRRTRFATINRLRETYLSLGFDEAENPVIIDEKGHLPAVWS